MLIFRFLGFLPRCFVLAEPNFKLLRCKDPDACSHLLTRVAALEHTAEAGRIIGQKGRLQHILAVLQFQIVMVCHSPAWIGRIVNMLVDQHTGLEFRQSPVLTITAVLFTDAIVVVLVPGVDCLLCIRRNDAAKRRSSVTADSASCTACSRSCSQQFK